MNSPSPRRKRVQNDLVDLAIAYRSDPERVELPVGDHVRADLDAYLVELLVNSDELVAHIRATESDLRQVELPDELPPAPVVDALLDRGPEALSSRELARLLLNPVALATLGEIVQSELPGPFADAFEELGARLARDASWSAEHLFAPSGAPLELAGALRDAGATRGLGAGGSREVRCGRVALAADDLTCFAGDPGPAIFIVDWRWDERAGEVVVELAGAWAWQPGDRIDVTWFDATPRTLASARRDAAGALRLRSPCARAPRAGEALFVQHDRTEGRGWELAARVAFAGPRARDA